MYRGKYRELASAFMLEIGCIVVVNLIKGNDVTCIVFECRIGDISECIVGKNRPTGDQCGGKSILNMCMMFSDGLEGELDGRTRPKVSVVDCMPEMSWNHRCRPT
jgi:hypothetical protein